MKTIVVAIDFSPLTQTLLSHAAVMARAFQAQVWLLHVATPEPDFVGYAVGPQHVRDERAGELRNEHRQLQHFADTLRGKGIGTDALLIQGPLVYSLLQKARELKTDLLIIGAHHRSRLFEAFIGGTWHDLISQSDIPLLVIPELGEESFNEFW